jgi:hypothetical protein
MLVLNILGEQISMVTKLTSITKKLAFREETTVRREIDEGFPQQLQANSEDLES